MAGYQAFMDFFIVIVESPEASVEESESSQRGFLAGPSSSSAIPAIGSRHVLPAGD